jgi:hypothetical protein
MGPAAHTISHGRAVTQRVSGPGVDDVNRVVVLLNGWL